MFLVLASVMLSLGLMAEVSFWDSSKPEKRFVFGVRAGVNVGTYRGELLRHVEQKEKDWYSKTGFFGGVSTDFLAFRNLSVNSGIFFTQKGYKRKKSFIPGAGGAPGVTAIPYRVTMNYIEIPLYVAYHVKINRNNDFQIFFGPYFDYGVYGKMSYDFKIEDTRFKGKEDLYDAPNKFDRFQLGLGIGAAYSYRKISIGLSNQWGLTEVKSGSDSYWDNFNVSVGYNF